MFRKPSPRATIVMTSRERHGLAEGAVDSVAANTAPPYRFLYLDVQSPERIRAGLARRAAATGMEVVRFDEPLWPHQARKRVADRLDTEYTVFVDNDVRVAPGWLDSLVACADETGAGIAGPLYLWGDGSGPALIHMAGGKLREADSPGGRILEEAHELVDRDPQELADRLVRRRCDFVEFHCMLIRTSLLARGSLLSDDVLCVHEHIDTALAARERGHSVYFEPTAKVTYLASADYRLDDLALFRARWSREAAEASIAAFCRRWNVVNDARSFGGVREFLRVHVEQVDPLRPARGVFEDRHLAMRRDELGQTRSDLLDLAAERGYEAHELAWLAGCYQLAHALADGGYRPCGRPFINHLVGTASVLVRYGFRAELVGAGLLHAAYTHAPPHPDGPAAAVDAVCAMLGGRGNPVEKRVRAYARRAPETGDPWADSVDAGGPVADGEIMAIAAANEVDLHLSGELRYTGRRDRLAPRAVERVVHACRLIGVGGLADALASAQRPAAAAPGLLTGVPVSYRIAADRQGWVPMAGESPPPLD
jgi:GT2 family glycosyltransferase